MEERTAEVTPARLPFAWLRSDWLLVVLLMVLSAGLHAWRITHTEVAARDSIGFIRYAWQLRHQPWFDVVRQGEQHPCYPLTILALSYPVGQLAGGPDSFVMQLSAQLASAAAGVLLILPMFYLGRELFNRGVGFWASLLFQCLPASGRVLSDGLSEGVFLLFAATAFLLAARALSSRSVLTFGLTGLFGGLAYLTRPEGALIVAATGLVLLLSSRLSTWRRTLACAAGLLMGTTVVSGPFLIVTQRLTTKPTAHTIFAAATGSEEGPGPCLLPAHWPLSTRSGDRQPLFASTLAVWWQGPRTSPAERQWWGLRALGYELMTGSYYVTWVPALLGLFYFHKQWRRPGVWMMLLVGVAVALLLWRVAMVMGYLSDRHTLLLIFCGSFWAVAAIGALGHYLGILWRWLGTRLGSRFLLRFGNGQLCAALLLLGLVGAMVPKTLEPLHVNRCGFRAAGLWLAQHATAADVIVDPYYWTHYYTGRVFHVLSTPYSVKPKRAGASGSVGKPAGHVVPAVFGGVPPDRGAHLVLEGSCVIGLG